MARNIKGFPAAEAGAAIVEGSAKAPKAEKEIVAREWLPMKFHEDGRPDSSCLTEAKYVEKTRIHNLIGGGQHVEKDTKFVKAGDSRYSVTERGELIAWYKKRGGTGHKLIRQFKNSYQDTPDGRARKKQETSFRAMLRSKGIPGA